MGKLRPVDRMRPSTTLRKPQVNNFTLFLLLITVVILKKRLLLSINIQNLGSLRFLQKWRFWIVIKSDDFFFRDHFILGTKIR